MESLALVVGVMFLVALASGPMALLITFIKPGKFFTNTTKKVLVSIFSVAASISGALFVASSSAAAIRVMGLVSLSLASLAIFRVFQPTKPIDLG